MSVNAIADINATPREKAVRSRRKRNNVANVMYRLDSDRVARSLVPNSSIQTYSVAW